MNYKRLGKTGLKVSEYCIGGDNFGGQTSAEESLRIMEVAFDAGVNFIDTANSYCDGLSEENVGRFVKTRRSEAIVATKGKSQIGSGPNDVGVNKKYVIKAIDDSLKRLGTDYVDLYQIHSPDLTTPIEETVEAYNDIVRSGKARYIGVSNFSGAQLVEALWAQDKNGFTKFKSVQPRYNLLYREAERELFPACLDQGVGAIVYSPQAGGFLLGKHRDFKVETSAGGRFSDDFKGVNFYKNTYWNEPAFNAMGQFLSIAEKYNVSPMALALKWVRSNPAVSSCIVGARTLEQIQQNLIAWEENVPMEAINSATTIGDNLWDTVPWKPQIHFNVTAHPQIRTQG